MQQKAINDLESLKFSLVPAVVDQAGIAFQKNGAPLTAADLPVAWSAVNVDENGDETGPNTVADLSGIAADGQSGLIGSATPGLCKLSALIGPYPDGSTVTFAFGLAVGFTKAGDPTFETSVEAETPAAPSGTATPGDGLPDTTGSTT